MIGHSSGGRLFFMALLALLAAAGCESKGDRLDDALAAAGQTRNLVYPLAGKVRIDGLPPKLKPRQRLIVMLNDGAKPEIPVENRPYVVTDLQGRFDFTTYTKGDGVEPGKYVMTFAVFDHHGKTGLEGPDQLHNLYNDPEKNAGISELVIDHKRPGSRDYNFDLAIAGKDAADPGPHALTTLHDPYFPTRKK